MKSWAMWTARTVLLTTGNAVAVLGDSSAGCIDGATVGGAAIGSPPARDGGGGGGESSGSLTTLAIGTLLAGAAALKLAGGGRPRSRPVKATGAAA